MSRTLSAILATLAMTVLIAGCGTEDLDPSAVADAAKATQAVRGVHLTASVTAESEGETLEFQMEGDGDLAGKRMALEMTGPGIGQLRQVLVGRKMYMSMEGIEEEFDAEWVAVDLDEVAEEAGIDLGAPAGTDPGDQLAYLRATGDIERVGEEDVDGVATTHYRGVVDLRKYPDTVPPAERETARRSIEKVIDLGSAPKVPVEVWVDDKNLVRRQKMTMEQSKPEEVRMEIDMHFSDFGKKVRIAPPRGDVKDVTDEMKDEIG